MTEEQLDKILAKIPTDKIYEDLLQPGLKKVGEALSNVFDLGNLIMLPFKLVNERSRIYLKSNLDRYEKKLAKIKEDDLCQVSEQIGLPIIDKLLLINQNELSEVFINLLTKASSKQTLHLVHPAFLTILNNLSQDEAIILFANKSCNRIPFLDIYVEKKTYSLPKPDHHDIKGAKSRDQLKESLNYNSSISLAHIKSADNLTGLEQDIKLYFPQNIDIYLENLQRLGIISFERKIHYLDNAEQHDKLTKTYNNIIEDTQSFMREAKSDEFSLKIDIRKGTIEFTELGISFINAVIKDIEELSNEE